MLHRLKTFANKYKMWIFLLQICVCVCVCVCVCFEFPDATMRERERERERERVVCVCALNFLTQRYIYKKAVNGMSSRYTSSFVHVQVLLSSLLGSFLCT